MSARLPQFRPGRLFTGLLLACAVTLATGLAAAERTPRPGRTDTRVRHVVYSPDDIVRVTGHYSYQTLIEFSGAEEVADVAIGDSEAWQIVQPSQPNLLFLKPIARDAGTNLTIVTLRPAPGGGEGTIPRKYLFALQAHQSPVPHLAELSERIDPNLIPAPLSFTESEDFTWLIRFTYPEDDVRRLAAATAAQARRDAERVNGATGVDPNRWNFEYSFAGAASQRPVNIFDNGTHTYFEFDRVHDLPAIFAVAPDQSESLLNHVVRGRFVVVHDVRRQFTLRKDAAVTCIFNEAYDAVPATTPTSPVHDPNYWD